MTTLFLFAAFLLGLLLGFLAAYWMSHSQKQSARSIATEMAAQFSAISQENVNSKIQSDRALSGQELEHKKVLIDQELGNLRDLLDKVSSQMQVLEKDRENKFGELSNQLKNNNAQMATLQKVTGTLSEALANSRARGQWGQRMAEDVLQLAGFKENINYLKEKTIEGIGSRPDITFLLPKDFKLNMDVKFPYDNYLRSLEATTEAERDRHKAAFFKDVKAKIKEITSRDYINPEQNTVDYVILFVPNEQIFNFIHEKEPEILDASLRSKVIFCSPITLFAILAVIRQAVENFSLERTSNEILELLGSFKDQWDRFVLKLDSMGKKILEAQSEYEALTTTRKKGLEKPLQRIEALRQGKLLSAELSEPILEISQDNPKLP